MLVANLLSKATIVGNERIRLKTVGPIIEDSGGLCAIKVNLQHKPTLVCSKNGRFQHKHRQKVRSCALNEVYLHTPQILCAINVLFSHIAHYNDVKKGKIEYL